MFAFRLVIRPFWIKKNGGQVLYYIVLDWIFPICLCCCCCLLLVFRRAFRTLHTFMVLWWAIACENRACVLQAHMTGNATSVGNNDALFCLKFYRHWFYVGNDFYRVSCDSRLRIWFAFNSSSKILINLMQFSPNDAILIEPEIKSTS